jgi:hypothetical protein
MPRPALLSLPDHQKLDTVTSTLIPKRFEVNFRFILTPQTFPFSSTRLAECPKPYPTGIAHKKILN